MVKQKHQILFIHGGETFKTRKDYINYLKTREISIIKNKRWREDLKKLKNFEVIIPDMPLKENAIYEDWKINFERYFKFLRNDVILIGSSLGGIFLAKYLSENKFSKKILSVYLVAPPFDNSHSSETLTKRFQLKSDLSMIEENCKNINLLFSKDDKVVPVYHAKRYTEKLKNANIIIYKNKNGHFLVSEFPELIKMIKSDLKK